MNINKSMSRKIETCSWIFLPFDIMRRNDLDALLFQLSYLLNCLFRFPSISIDAAYLTCTV